MPSRIVLPNKITVHAFKDFLSQNAFFPTDTPDHFTLEFHERFNHLEPFAVAMLAAWASYWVSRGIPITCENATGRSVNYLRRMGLFNHLPLETPWPLQQHEEAGRFIPLKAINTQQELTAFLVDVIPLLHMCWRSVSLRHSPPLSIKHGEGDPRPAPRDRSDGHRGRGLGVKSRDGVAGRAEDGASAWCRLQKGDEET